jgi:benzylsuccinate CoA-transferase BbsF subunit
MSYKSILDHIRILDFSWVLAGPYATRMLADFGAEVIKIQPLLPEGEDRFSRGYYNTWNRNKLGITLDLSKSEGIEIARKLVGISDAAVENFSPRVMDNWGLGYPELKNINPQIILISMSVMGHTGPQRDYVGFGPTVQAFSGITCLTAYPDQLPLGLGFSYSDHVAGLYASLSLLSALEHRRKTGEGQFIDLSQMEAMTSLLGDAFLEFTRGKPEVKPAGNRSDKFAPHGIYPCQGNDRWCAITVTTSEEWEGFKRALSNPDWANEARFSSLESRLENVETLENFVGEWTRQYPAEEVMIRMQREKVPAGVVQNAADLANDPQLESRGFFRKIDHPGLGRNFADASPIHLSDGPTTYRRAAPLRGQDNEYVYRDLLGLTENEINYLKRNKVI